MGCASKETARGIREELDPMRSAHFPEHRHSEEPMWAGVGGRCLDSRW